MNLIPPIYSFNAAKYALPLRAIYSQYLQHVTIDFSDMQDKKSFGDVLQVCIKNGECRSLFFEALGLGVGWVVCAN